MTNNEILEFVGNLLEQSSVIMLTDEEIQSMTEEQSFEVAERFGARGFLKLPKSEIAFFEWLRTHDEAVWNDLWSTSDSGETGNLHDEYVIGIGALPLLLRGDRGFPICDLETEPNYYFTGKHFFHEEAKPFLDAVQQRVENGDELSLAEVFVTEIRNRPIDIWRFAYNYQIPISAVKQTVESLVHDGILRHTTSKDELSEYLEF